MESVAVAKIVGNEIGYRLLLENGNYEDASELTIINQMRYRGLKVQNLGYTKISYMSSFGFITGSNYPEIHGNDYSNRNMEKFTMIGYLLNNNGKFYVISSANGILLVVSSIEVGLLEKYNSITNASYTSNGKVRLDNGTMQEVSKEIAYKASQTGVENTKLVFDEVLRRNKIGGAPRALGEPNFGRLDSLEKQLPDHNKRRESYRGLYSSYSSGASSSDIGDIACLVGLGALSFALSSVSFAAKMRVGNAILDSILDK